MAWETILRICNGAVNLVILLLLLLWGSYGAYALWDNSQVLGAAVDVQEQLLLLKPEPDAPAGEKNSADAFTALRNINPDVCGWITMDNTRIDFPIVRGQNNLTYINRDVYGNFALAGSIFLDSRNEPSFSEQYCLLYGHHMADGNMFGDLDKYKEKAFFEENRKGTLILPERTYGLDIISCLLVPASDEMIFDPESTQDAMQSLLEDTRERAMLCHEEAWQRAYETEGLQIIALSTCASEFTDARTVVLAAMYAVQPEE